MALDAVAKKGFDVSIRFRHYDSQCEVWIVPAECRSPCWLGINAELGRAICLALEQWLDAQKEKQDDSG